MNIPPSIEISTAQLLAIKEINSKRMHSCLGVQLPVARLLQRASFRSRRSSACRLPVCNVPWPAGSRPQPKNLHIGKNRRDKYCKICPVNGKTYHPACIRFKDNFAS